MLLAKRGPAIIILSGDCDDIAELLRPFDKSSLAALSFFIGS